MGELKSCTKCHQQKDLSEFRKHSGRKDGLSTQCRMCASAANREHYQRNKESHRERCKEYQQENAGKIAIRRRANYRANPDLYKKMQIKYNQSPKGKLNAIRGMKAQQERNAEKVRVRRITRTAINNGTLKRLPCEVCGDPKSDAHHEDYSKPLDVKWLCRKHHFIAHGKSIFSEAPSA